MKIAVIAHAHFVIARPYAGGLEAHTHQLVNELVRLGHDVTLYAKAGSLTDAKLVPIFYGNAFEGKHPLYDKGYTYAMKRISLGRYDVIFNNSLNYVPLLKHTPTMPPMVTVFHTPPFPKMSNVIAKQTSLTNRIYLAVSDFTAAQWQPFCNSYVQTVSNGIDLSTWQPEANYQGEARASWVGRITPEKGTHLALLTCIQMGLPLTFGGFISDKKYFKQEIKPLLKDPLITYAGHADREQVNQIYKQSSVALVTPLWDEPFGLVAIEALASGTPVAAFGRGGLQSIIVPAVGELASHDTPEALQAIIPAAMQKQRDTCIRYAYENFTVEKMVASYLQLIPFYSEQENEGLTWTTAQYTP